MAATPTDVLIDEAKCIESCIVGADLKMAVLISLFAKIAGMATDTNALIEGAKCIQQCVPQGMLMAVLVSLADQINQGGGGGGSGSSCLGRSVGAPVWVPAATCQAAVNFDDQGGMWWYDNASATWIQFA